MSDEISAEMKRKYSGWVPAAKQAEKPKPAPAKKTAPKPESDDS